MVRKFFFTGGLFVVTLGRFMEKPSHFEEGKFWKADSQ